MNIYILCAQDRYNYGDLLFSLVLEKYFKESQRSVDYNLYYCGFIDSKMSAVGAKDTVSFKKIEKNISRNDAIIIAGGGVLGQTMRSLDKHLSKNSIHLYSKVILHRSLSKIGMVEKHFKKKYGSLLFTPFVIDKDLFNCKVIYNSVGGNICKLSDSLINDQVNNLKKADYLSIREYGTKHMLENYGVNNTVVAPDSAILISKYFGDKLTELCSNNVTNVVDGIDEYVVFQCSNDYYNSHKDTIDKAIETLSNKCKVILLPIGFAPLHDDNIALEKIYKKVNSKNIIYMNKLNIYDIMYIISKAKIFFGSSLHGCITSMSFETPFVPLADGYSKLKSYVNAWGSEHFNDVAKSEDIVNLYSVYRDNNFSEELKECRNKQINASLDSLNNIADIIF